MHTGDWFDCSTVYNWQGLSGDAFWISGRVIDALTTVVHHGTDDHDPFSRRIAQDLPKGSGFMPSPDAKVDDLRPMVYGVADSPDELGVEPPVRMIQDS
jgi:hypothetical protein